MKQQVKVDDISFFNEMFYSDVIIFFKQVNVAEFGSASLV